MHIIIVAGELSGDQLGEGVVRILKKKYPNIKIEGIAGPKMIKKGCRTLYPMESLSVMGFIEIIKQMHIILKISLLLLYYIKKQTPDIYIGIDLPDFNLNIENILKKRNIKTIHYVSPSIWAWRESRIIKIKKATNIVFSLLPFEVLFYKKYNHTAIFIGHPLAKKIPIKENTYYARKIINIKTKKIIIAILPGSRKQEIKRILPIFLYSLMVIKEKKYYFNGVIAVSSKNIIPQIKKHKKIIKDLNIKIVKRNTHNILQASDYALIASGTASLEAMLCKKPMIVGYKMSKTTAYIAKKLIKTKFISLPNIISKERIVPEYVQNDLTVKNCVKTLEFFFKNPIYIKNIKKKFTTIHKRLLENTNQKILKEIEKLLLINS